MTPTAEFDELSGQVPWSQLQHAGGQADDTPAHLRAVWAGGRTSPELLIAGYGHLWRDLLGGGRVWTATAPAAYLMAILVQDQDFGDPDPTLSQGVFAFFRELAIATGDDDSRWTVVTSILELVGPPPHEACRLALPSLFQTELSMLRHANVRTASYAATAAVAIAARRPIPVPDRARIVRWLDARSKSDLPIADRAMALIDLGELGHVRREFLRDEHRGIRLAAAMADDGDDALDVLLRLAESPGELDTVLSPPGDFGFLTLPQFRGRRVPAVVAEAVCIRVSDTGRLARGAQASFSMASSPGGKAIVRPYLLKIFPAGQPQPGAANTTQTQIAQAMVENRAFWDWPGRTPLFESMGLPPDEESWRFVFED